MAFVAIVALDFGARRALNDLANRLLMLTHSNRPPHMIHALIMGALPMANVLGLAFLIGRRRGSRFLLGFEVFGATALALYVTAVSLYTEELVPPFLDFLEPLVVTLRDGTTLGTSGVLIVESAVALILLLPQVGFALAGGFLLRKLRMLSLTTAFPSSGRDAR
jgi:hypothetical protein